MSDLPVTGLVLSGGGARGAYQAGVLKAIHEISARIGIPRPLPVLTGVSAGAINAVYLASRAHEGPAAADQLVDLWSNLVADRVFKTDALTAGRSGLRLLADAAVGALYTKKLARSLLDTDPLWSTIRDEINFFQIASNIRDGHLRAAAVTAMNYSTAISETFFEGVEEIKGWNRSRRSGLRTQLDAPHIMASSAIPLFFPPVAIGDQHFGDGCLRNAAPLSPAIHLGAKQLLVISVRRPDNLAVAPAANLEPSFARVLGVILNALLLDAVDLDMERLMRINSTIAHVPNEVQNLLNLRRVEWLWIRPSKDIGLLAAESFDDLPRVIRYLVAGLGSSREASEITSYLLFAPSFCGKLVELGYQDGIAMSAQIESFLLGQTSGTAPGESSITVG